MSNDAEKRKVISPFRRAVIEVLFIIFLFYANLLMGEFTATNGHGKTLLMALSNIFTENDFSVAVAAALIGYFVFEYLRKRL